MKPYYAEGDITIYHGDCRAVLLALNVSPGLVIADPPYGLALDTDNTGTDVVAPTFAQGRRRPGRSWERVHGDDEPFDPSHLLQYPRLVIWGANNFASRLPESNRWIVWNKRGEGLPSAMHFGDCELAWSNVGRGGIRMFSNNWHGTARWRGGSGEPMLHPTQKPVALMRWIVEQNTETGDLVLDPYMGSGPVARACADLGRRYVGIEIEERYCEIAAKRCAQEVLDLEAA